MLRTMLESNFSAKSKGKPVIHYIHTKGKPCTAKMRPLMKGSPKEIKENLRFFSKRIDKVKYIINGFGGIKGDLILIIKKTDRDRTRPCNPQIRSLVPYPLGHTASVFIEDNQ